MRSITGRGLDSTGPAADLDTLLATWCCVVGGGWTVLIGTCCCVEQGGGTEVTRGDTWATGDVRQKPCTKEKLIVNTLADFVTYSIIIQAILIIFIHIPT